LRQATKKGLELSVLNPIDDDLLMPVAYKAIVPPASMTVTLAQLVKAAAGARNVTVPHSVRAVVDAAPANDVAQNLAKGFAAGSASAILLGNLARHHPQAAILHALAQALAEVTGARLGVLAEAANSVGGYIAGAVPFGTIAGKNVAQMIDQPLKAYLLLGLEADLDTHDPARTVAALKQAELVVAMTPFEHAAALEYAHVMLPIGPFTETAGTFINMEGTIQSFNGVVQPLGETRPAWKVLRVLGNMLGLIGFGQDSADAVKREALSGGDIAARLSNRTSVQITAPHAAAAGGLQRIGDVPMYSGDPLVRRSPPLQKTRHAQSPVAWVSPPLYQRLGLMSGDFLRVRQDRAEAIVPVGADERLPDDCIRLAAARPETATLGAMFGPVTAERVAGEQKVAV
jgi:NADH-quinone oxidoreductase subunit G